MSFSYNNMQQKLKSYLSRFLKTHEDIEDLAQESFLKVLEASSKSEIQHPKSYLYRTARNLALNNIAKKSNQLTDSLEDLVGIDVLISSGLLEDDAAAQERFELFCQAAAALPEITCKVLVLRKVYGFSRKEVAEQLDISVSGVEKHLAKALDNCIQYIETTEGTVKTNKPTRVQQ